MSKNNVNKLTRVLTITSVMFLLIIIIVQYIIVNNLKENIIEDTIYDVQQMAEYENKQIDILVQGWYKQGEALGSLCVEDGKFSGERAKEIVKEINANEASQIAVFDSEGKGYDRNGEEIDVSREVYFQNVLRGETMIVDVRNKPQKQNGEIAEVDRNIYVAAVVPITDENGEVLGGVAGYYSCSVLEKLLNYDTKSGSVGMSFLITKTGMVLVGDIGDVTEDTLYENEEMIERYGDEHMELIRDEFEKREGGGRASFIMLEEALEDTYVIYQSNVDSDWIFLTILDEEQMVSYSEEATDTIASFMKSCFVVIIVLCVLILGLFYHILKSLRNGEKRLEIEKERFQIVTEQMETIVFECAKGIKDKKETFYISKNFAEEFGVSLPKTIGEMAAHMHKEDGYTYEQFVEKIKENGGKYTYEFRMKKGEKYEWYRAIITLVQPGTKYQRIIGKALNIQKEREKYEKLRKKAMTDDMTKLYNKASSLELIVNCVNEEDRVAKHAFFFIDIDNFKGVNDTFGHDEGDKLITLFADTIRNTFKETDIVGRFGGDEFLVFVKDYADREEVRELAQRLCEQIYNKSEENGKYQFSASVGIAFYPEHGTTVEELMANADKALYQSKKAGKNQYTIYTNE